MSTLEVSNLNDGTTTVATTFVTNGSAKAWLEASSSASLNNSYNISSGTDNGTGNYDLTFTTAMGNATYAPAVATLHAEIPSIGQQSGDRTTTFYQVIIFSRADSLTAADQRAFSQIFGDLA